MKPIAIKNAEDIKTQPYDDLTKQIESISEALAGLETLHRQAKIGLNAATIAHELNNLLTPMVAFAQLAISKPDKRDLTEKALNMAIQQGQQAGRVMEALILFSAPKARHSQANLKRATQNALSCMARDLEKDRICFNDTIPNIDLAINDIALQQILYNLIHNACQAMGKTGGTLSLQASTKSSNAKILFSDTAKGIPQETQDSLFIPFKRGDQSTGHGLGLYLSRQLAREANGDLKLLQTNQQGTIFELTLNVA